MDLEVTAFGKFDKIGGYRTEASAKVKVKVKVKVKEAVQGKQQTRGIGGG